MIRNNFLLLKQFVSCAVRRIYVSAEFLDNDFYRHDYESITKALISDYVSYDQAARRLREIADMLF